MIAVGILLIAVSAVLGVVEDRYLKRAISERLSREEREAYQQMSFVESQRFQLSLLYGEKTRHSKSGRFYYAFHTISLMLFAIGLLLVLR